MIIEIKKNLKKLMDSKRQLKIYREIDENNYTALSKSFIGSIYEILEVTDIVDQAEINS